MEFLKKFTIVAVIGVLGLQSAAQAQGPWVGLDCQLDAKAKVGHKSFGFNDHVYLNLDPEVAFSEGDTAVEIFPGVEEELRNYSMVPFSYFVTPVIDDETINPYISNEVPKLELGVYRYNKFEKYGRKKQMSVTFEAAEPKVKLSFQHQALRTLDIDISCSVN